MPMVGGTVTVPTMGGTMDAQGGLQYKNGQQGRARELVRPHP